MTIIEKDPDLIIGEIIPCSAGVSRGYKEVVDRCEENPELYIDMESLGTFLHKSRDMYRVISEEDFVVEAARAASLGAREISLESDLDTSIMAGERALFEAIKSISLAAMDVEISGVNLSSISAQDVRVTANDVLRLSGEEVEIMGSIVRVQNLYIERSSGDFVSLWNYLSSASERLDSSEAEIEALKSRVSTLEGQMP